MESLRRYSLHEDRPQRSRPVGRQDQEHHRRVVRIHVIPPPYAANHQTSYRIASHIDIYELRTSLTILLESNGITAHGNAIKLMLEQSNQRKRDYAQFMKARDRLSDDLVCDDGYFFSFTDFQRSLRLFSTGSWRVLGGPGPNG